MKHNITFTDKILRLLAASVFIALYLRNIVTGTLGMILVALAVVFAATALVNYCPIYTLLGIHKWEKKS